MGSGEARDAHAMIERFTVLLDLDGTLVDSYPGIFASCVAALRFLGHAPDDAIDIKRHIGPPLEEMMARLLEPLGDDKIADAVSAYRQHYGETGFLRTEPYPGIGNALHEMQSAGWRLYLATSKREIFARRILDHLGFAPYFDGIHGSAPGGTLDRKPELLAHVLSQHHILPRNAVMVGDRGQDILGARAVGMRSLGVLWGYGSRDELLSTGAHRLVERPADLVPAILSLVNETQTQNSRAEP